MLKTIYNGTAVFKITFKSWKRLVTTFDIANKNELKVEI